MADLVIQSFNAGELSPLLDGRSDLEKYYFGARVYDNMIPTQYGPAERRPGTYFVAELKNNDKKAKLVSFQYSTEQAYILEYGDEYIRFFKDRGQIITGVGTEDISALDNQIAHWLLNETSGVTVVDDVNIVPHNGEASVDCDILHEEGHVGTGCFDLDGQYTVEITDHADFSFTDNADDDPFSIVCWAFVTEQVGVQVLLSKWRDDDTSREWRFSVNDELKLQLHLAATNADLSDDGVVQWKLNDNAANTNVISSGPQYEIDGFDDGVDTVTITGDGDLSSSFPDGSEFTIENSVSNDGQYTVVSSTFAGDPDFVITIAAASLTDADTTGTPTIAPHAGVATANTEDFNATGKISGALDFGGQYAVEIDDSADFSFDDSGDNPFSIVAWVYVTSYSGTQMILSKYDMTTGAEAREWELYLHNDYLHFVLWDESETHSYVGKRLISKLTTGWHFIVATYDSVGGATAYDGTTLYVDGSLIPAVNLGSGNYVAMENLATKVVIGANECADGNLGNFWQDKIDNVVIFDIELTQSNVSALWNDGNGTELMAAVEVSAVANTPLSLGWHFLACTYSAPVGALVAIGIRLYVDGAVVNTTMINSASYTAMQAAGEAIRIGSQNNSDNSADENFWGDKIDEVSVFKDVLTAAEIASLYSTTPYEIESDYLEADLFELQHAQSADVLYNVHGDYPQSKLMRYSHTWWELEDIVYDWPPFLDENITDTTITPSATVGTIELTASAPIFTPDYVGSYWLIKHPRTDNKIEHDFGAAVGKSPILVDVRGSWRLRTSGTWTGTIEVQRVYDKQMTLVLDVAPAGGAWAADDIITGATSGDTCIIVSVTDSTHYVIKQLSGSFTDAEILSNQSGNSRNCGAGHPTYTGWHTITTLQSTDDQNFNVPGEETDGKAYYRVECTAADDAALKIVLSCERYYHYGIVKITGFTSATSATGTVIRTLGAVTATKRWSEGAWSDERGYPVTTAFYEGRLWNAGTSYRPLNIWGSRIDDYENMDVGDKLDDDAVKFTVDSTMQNMIRWLVGQEVLLIGTSGGEWRLGSTDPADAITPTNPMRPRIQTTYGSKEIQALLLANAVLFIDAAGRKVRGAQYIFEKGESGGYDAPDYTMLSEHITESGIIGMAYQQNPYPILWCWRTDGKMIGMVFEPGQKVWGWFPLVIDGEVESVAVESGTPEDTIWIIVKRVIGGVDKRYIEYFKPRDWGDDQADCFFVDSGLTFDGGDSVIIGAITRADPCIVSAVAHGLENGDNLKISFTELTAAEIAIIESYDANSNDLIHGEKELLNAKLANLGLTAEELAIIESYDSNADGYITIAVDFTAISAAYFEGRISEKLYDIFLHIGFYYTIAISELTVQAKTLSDRLYSIIEGISAAGTLISSLSNDNMVEVENKVFTVADKATDSFTLRDKNNLTDINSSDFTTYTAGAILKKVDNAFSGLDHLEGKTVSVLGDGSVHADVVVSSGAVTLTDYYNKVHIGLPFASKLMPMKLAVPGANIRGKVKRINEIIFSFYKTLGAKFGTTEGSETIPFRKTIDPMGSPSPLFTGEKRQTFNGGYELEGNIYIEQTQPLPMTMRSITAKLGIHDG